MRQANFRIVNGDIMKLRADALVCPVNCKAGVMGAGLAKAFASEFPGVRLRHKELVDRGDLGIGTPCLVRGMLRKGWPDDGSNSQAVILFPTKMHWKDPSQYRWIFEGLAHLYHVIGSFDVQATGRRRCEIAFPALGCGLGGLPYAAVFRLIEDWAIGLDDRFTVTLINHGD